MKNTNHLVSSDNKGYASLLFERALNPGALPGEGSVLGAFAQSSEGDVTPNIRGDFCTSGEKCDFETSTCSHDPTDVRPSDVMNTNQEGEAVHYFTYLAQYSACNWFI